MDMPATSQKCPASSLLNTEARQPIASIGSISPPHAQSPTPTDNDAMLYSNMWHQKGGQNHERKFHIPHTSPPSAFCTKAKVANGGAYLRDTTVYDLSSAVTAS